MLQDNSVGAYTLWLIRQDGRNRIELQRKDCIKVSLSPYPVPTVCRDNQSDDWFESLQRCLHWNSRVRQKGQDDFVSLDLEDIDLFSPMTESIRLDDMSEDAAWDWSA